jgi:hypothetical protein
MDASQGSGSDTLDLSQDLRPQTSAGFAQTCAPAPIDHGGRLVADNPGVVPRHDNAHLTRTDVVLGSIGHPDANRPREVVLEVGASHSSAPATGFTC